MPGVSNLYDEEQFPNNNTNAEPQMVAPAMPTRANEQSPRFKYWAAFFIVTLVVTGATIETTDKVQGSARSITNQKLAVSCAVSTFVIVFAVLMMHMSPISSIIFVSTKAEGGIIFVLIMLWSTLVGCVTDAGNDLAVDTEGSIIHGNLYLAGWAGVAIVAALLLNYFKEVYSVNINEELALRSERLNLWIYYTLGSVILLCSAANVYDIECLLTDRKATMFCGRAVMVMCNSGFGCVCSILIIGLKFVTNISPHPAELTASGLIFLFNAFSLGLVTSETAPGGKVGNIFYFSWICIVLSFVLFAATFDNAAQKKKEAKDAKEERIAAAAGAQAAAAVLLPSYDNMEGDFTQQQQQQQHQFNHNNSPYYDNSVASAAEGGKEYMNPPEKPYGQESCRSINTDNQTYVSEASTEYSGAPKKDNPGYAYPVDGDPGAESSIYSGWTGPTKDTGSSYGAYPTKGGSGYSVDSGGSYSYGPQKGASHFNGGSSQSYGGASYNPQKGNYGPQEQFEDEISTYTEENNNLKKGPTKAAYQEHEQFEDESVWSEETDNLKKGYDGGRDSYTRQTQSFSGADSLAYSACTEFDDYNRISTTSSQYSGSVQKRTPYSSDEMSNSKNSYYA